MKNSSKEGSFMPYPESGKIATAKYLKANLDDIKVRVPKGRREVYKAYAEKQGKSLNGFIIELMDAHMMLENSAAQGEDELSNEEI